VEAENALATQSTRHPDGWGIGWFVDDDAYIIKSSNAAHACDRFQRVSTRLTSHTFVVHVRRATVGNVDHLNAHPFRFGRWLFAHNGTLFGFDRLGPWMLDQTDPSLLPLILGDTDSEHLFYYLLTRLDRAGIDRTGRAISDSALVGRVIRDSLLELDVKAIELGLYRPILNVVLTDGRNLVAHKAGMPLFLSTQKFSCADYDTCLEPSKVCMENTRPAEMPVNHLLVASEAIASEENRWESFEDGSTVVLGNDFILRMTPPAEGWVAPTMPPPDKRGATP
jgi:glutamine amidotransferase